MPGRVGLGTPGLGLGDRIGIGVQGGFRVEGRTLRFRTVAQKRHSKGFWFGSFLIRAKVELYEAYAMKVL